MGSSKNQGVWFSFYKSQLILIKTVSYTDRSKTDGEESNEERISPQEHNSDLNLMMERKPVKATHDRGDIIPEEKSSLATPFWMFCTLENRHLNVERKKETAIVKRTSDYSFNKKNQLRNLAPSHKLEAYNEQNVAIVISCTKCGFQFHDTFLCTTLHNRWVVAFCWWSWLQFHHSSCLQQEIHSFVSSCSKELLTSKAHLYSLCGNSCGRGNLLAYPMVCWPVPGPTEKGKAMALRCIGLYYRPEVLPEDMLNSAPT